MKFRWTDSQWRGSKLKGPDHIRNAHRDLHAEGTWQAAAEQLAELARIGITVIEMMPIGDFPGRFGWGYDGWSFSRLPINMASLTIYALSSTTRIR